MFFFKQKTAYEMRISDWSSDVCSSDLNFHPHEPYRHDECDDAGSNTHGIEKQRAHLSFRPLQFFDHIMLEGDVGKVSLLLLMEVLKQWSCLLECLRSEVRRVGKECVRTCSSRGSLYT